MTALVPEDDDGSGIGNVRQQSCECLLLVTSSALSANRVAIILTSVLLFSLCDGCSCALTRSWDQVAFERSVPLFL